MFNVTTRCSYLITLFMLLPGGVKAEETTSSIFLEPIIMLGAGISLKISADVTARVFGNHECLHGLVGDEDVDQGTGCTVLTGNDDVLVRLAVGKGMEQLVERWRVVPVAGSSLQAQFVLTRPNGWNIRVPIGSN